MSMNRHEPAFPCSDFTGLTKRELVIIMLVGICLVSDVSDNGLLLSTVIKLVDNMFDYLEQDF